MKRINCSYESYFSDGVLEFILQGEIDHHNAVNMRTQMDRDICRFMPKRVVLVLGGIEFMDSSGLGLIMGRYALVQKLSGEFSISNPSERVLRVFELSGLGRIIKIENIRKKEEGENI